VATGSGWAAAQAAADAAVLAVKLLVGKDPGLPPGMGVLVGPPVPNVLIGGFPCPPIGEMAVGGLMRALSAARRALRNFRSSRRGNASCANGTHPVYLVTGENFDAYVDFVSDGLFRWERHYTTARHRQDGPLGFGHRHLYQRSLEVRLHRARYTDWDGEVFEFPRFARGSDTVRSNGYVLRRLGPGRYRVLSRTEPAMDFEGGAFDGALPLRRLTTADAEVELTYDDLGRLAAMTERRRDARAETRYELRYDRGGHITSLLEAPAGGAEPIVRATYAYSRAGALIEAQDALGGRWRYELDWFHRMVKQTDPRGYAYTFKYDTHSRCVWASGEDGLWWAEVQYFPGKRLTRYTEGERATWEFHYDHDGFVTKVVDPYGAETKRVRDAEGKIVREVDSGGRALRWRYDANGAHDARVDRFGHEHPPEREQARMANPLARALPATARARQFAGLAETLEPAVLGLMSSLLDMAPEALGDLAARTFRAPPSPGAPPPPRVVRDALGRRVREVDGQGLTRAWRRDETGNVVEYVDRDGRRDARRTTSWNLLGEKLSAAGQSIRYRYSSLEQVTDVIDPLGNLTRYDYDLKERLVRVHRLGRAREEYVFDAGDHLVEKRTGAGETLYTNAPHESHFVGLRRLASGGLHRFDYDDRGRVTEASTERHAVKVRYDEAGGRLSDLRDGRGVQRTRLGARAQVTRVLERYTLAEERRAHGAFLTAPDGTRTRLRFDGGGGALRECGNGTSELLQYDGEGRLAGRLAWRRASDGALVAWSTRYEYSAEGDRVAVVDSDRGTTRFAYDDAHRLAAEVTPDGRRLAYELDAADNLVSRPGLGRVEVGAGNLLVASARELFAYDARDHLAQRRDRVTGAVTRYVYDSFDMLVRVEATRGDGAAEEPWEYAYDGIGRRLWVRRGAYRREFYWDGDRLAAEVLPSGAVRVYQYAGVDALCPIAFTEYTDADAAPEAGRTLHVFSDPVGMPLHIEDERGRAVWWAVRVDPYGAVEVHPASEVEYNLRWPGHYFDPETGLHCNRHRAYDPALGPYLQCDPIGYRGSEVNLYGYCANPLVDVDVLGLTHENRPPRAAGSEDPHPRTDGEGPPHPTDGDPPPPRVPGAPPDDGPPRPRPVIDENIGRNLPPDEAARVMDQRTRAFAEDQAQQASQRTAARQSTEAEGARLRDQQRAAAGEVSDTGRRVGETSRNPDATDADRAAARQAHEDARTRRDAAQADVDAFNQRQRDAPAEPPLAGRPGAVYEPAYDPESGRMVVVGSGPEPASPAIERLPPDQSLTPSTAPGNCGMPRAAGVVVDGAPADGPRPTVQTTQGGYSFRNDGTVEHVNRCDNCGDIAARPGNQIETVGGLPDGVPADVPAGERTPLPRGGGGS